MTTGGDDEDSPPSLRELAERVSSRGERPEADQPAETVGEDQPVEDAAAESGFVFPGDHIGMDAKTEATVELIGDAPNLLLQGPTDHSMDDDLCTSLLEPTTAEPSNLLLVTSERSPDERLQTLRGYLDRLPTNIVILSIGDRTRSSASTALPDTGNITVETIPDAADIQRVGIMINRYLAEWAAEGTTSVLCFHSLNSLLRAVEDTERVYRFLNILVDRVESANATAHYHLDPDTADESTVSLFQPLFTETLVFDTDGTVSVDYDR